MFLLRFVVFEIDFCVLDVLNTVPGCKDAKKIFILIIYNFLIIRLNIWICDIYNYKSDIL